MKENKASVWNVNLWGFEKAMWELFAFFATFLVSQMLLQKRLKNRVLAENLEFWDDVKGKRTNN